MSLEGSGAACATLKQQQVPVSFTLAPIPKIRFTAPKARPKPATATEGGGDRLTGKLTLEIPFPLDYGQDFTVRLRAMMSVLGLSEGADTAPTESLEEPAAGASSSSGSQQAAQPQTAIQSSGAEAPTAAAAATSVNPAMQHRAANGVNYYVCGDPQGPFATISSLAPERKQQLLAANTEAWSYFGSEPHMFYYTDGSIGVAANSSSSSSSSSMLCHPQSLRDHSTTINLITEAMVEAHGLPVRPTSRQLATGAVKVAVTHELVHEQLSVCLLPGSRHAAPRVSASSANGSGSPGVAGAPSPCFGSSASSANGSGSPGAEGAPSAQAPADGSDHQQPGNREPSGFLSSLTRPVAWANSKVLKGAERASGPREAPTAAR
ncbi:hypothetical protein PLESTF_000616600 [Pleodorina starrii]|nr:hypothetical protein PLESTF_000616600 [Pleodorina starrii]